MSAEESHGSHSLNSFASQLELSIPQSPQPKKKMGVKWKNTAQNLPPDVYEQLKTPPNETQAERKIRVQKITREWANKWRNYEELDKYHEESFAVNPPLGVLGIRARAPPAPGVNPHPTSLKTHEDFPEAYQRYLKRTAHLAKNLARDLSASVQIPQRDASTVAGASKPQAKPKKKKTPGVKPSGASASGTQAPTSSCQRTTGLAPASRLRTDESGSAPEASSTIPQRSLKRKAPKETAMRGSLQAFNSDEEEDEFEDLAGFVANKEQKIEYIHAASRRKAEATGSEIPLLLGPKKILEYIEIWAVKPDTPLDDLDIPKEIKFYVQQFLINEIHHRDLKTQLSKQLAKVHHVFRKWPVASVTPEEFT